MVLSINRLVSLGIFLICLTEFGSALYVVTEPQTYSSLTTKLNISCIVDGPAYLTKSIVSIQIVRHIEDKPIAIVSMGQDLKMADGIKGNVKAEGHIDKQSTKSYLTLIIDNPDRQDAGFYRCQMFFIDENFQMVEANVMGNVTYEEPNIMDIVKDLTQKVHILSTRVQDQNNTDIKLIEQVDKQAKQIEVLNKDNKDKQKQLDMLIDYIEKQNQTIEEHQLKLHTMEQKFSFLDEGWQYYEADKTFIKIFGKDDLQKRRTWYQARDACKAFDGNLVQIRDENKNTFVYNMFAGARKYNTWIGIQNMASRGYNFKYVDGSSLGSYQPFHWKRVDGSLRTDDKCVTLITDTENPRQWYDDNCSHYKPYVCSKP